MESKKTFMDRVAPWLVDSDMVRVRGAYYMAKYGHRGQFRKEPGPDGKPLRYFEHPRRVALVLMDELECYDPNLIIACLLHDCLEDSPDIDAGIIEQFFGQRVAQLVRLLTKDPKEGYLDRVLSDPDAILVKMCDRIDNLRSLKDTERSFQERQVDESYEYLSLFSAKLANELRIGHRLGMNLYRQTLEVAAQRLRAN